ncbi:MAG: peptide chain release factor N(5)-glutamine methyltransferase [Lentisphaerae bacterium]|jgi:release factor glutamine methyltransferase|nr:peptide chain release factor N(5)-glutamine methyltransferase [Lentisphaerota bacterium]
MPSRPGTWAQLLADSRARLEATGVDEAESRLRWLAAHLLDCGLLDVQRHLSAQPTPARRDAFARGVDRLAVHEPVQYVIGETDFLGLRVLCDQRALIPRPETEELTQLALEKLRPMPGQPVVVDACTGSGCVACALALMAPQARVLATDISSDALALASENARRLGANVEFIQTDLLEGLPPASVDMVVSNPPYVSTADCANLPAHVRDFEPAMALDGGRDGLQLISRLVSQAARVIVPEGWLLLEIGDDQAEAIRRILCPRNQFNLISLRSDYAGRERLALAKRVRKSSRAPTGPDADTPASMPL